MQVLPSNDLMRFLIKGLVFVGLNAIILAGLLWFFSGQQRDIRLSYAQSESNLLVTGENTRYGMVLLGTSRGRVLSRDGNHQQLEQILGRRVANLSKGGGGGLMPAELHLSHFFYRGNTTDRVVYLVDPWVFFSEVNNEENDFFLRDEPFELDILKKLISDGYPTNRILSYLQMIGITDWEQISRYAAPGLTDGTLQQVDPVKMEKARNHYLERYDLQNFAKYGGYVDRINALAKRNGSGVIYIMVPILMPDFPGAEQVDRLLTDMAARTEDVTYYNCIAAMHDRHYFYDHMHFNRAGIARFAEEVLLPVLSGAAPTLAGCR